MINISAAENRSLLVLALIKENTCVIIFAKHYHTVFEGHIDISKYNRMIIMTTEDMLDVSLEAFLRKETVWLYTPLVFLPKLQK